jgi:Na+/proline symporter/signal transduction histidine kinase
VFSPAAVLAAILVYAGVLFAVAQISEGRAAGARWVSHPVVHSLALAVYCTTWTYYGSVGKASVDGMLFVAIYLGPTLAMVLGSTLMRRMVRLKNAHHITSIADFMSARYAKSQLVAALATVVVMVGIVPYLALQLKAVTGTFALLTRRPGEVSEGSLVSPVVVVVLVVFTVVFGIRRLDPTERHPGIVVSLAVESVIKLIAFVAAGVFVVHLAFGGVGGFVEQLHQPLPRPLGFMARTSGSDLLTWCTYLVLAASAFAFLPRQFHVGVIENPDPGNVRTSMWLTPLYLLVINICVLPIALGGLLLAPRGASPDEFVLALPMAAGQWWLSLLVFIGGFSAAIGMIMVEAMTMATMVSNHLVLPVLEWAPRLRSLRRYLLQARWAAAAAFILAAWGFEVTIGRSFMLVSMGMLSFAAVLQFAPIILGGLLWRRANRMGALAGLAAGFVTWLYTLIVPTFVKSGWMSAAVMEQGPLALSFLRPEAMFGLHGVPPLAHGVLWTMVFNVGFFVAGSVLFETSDDELRLKEEFLDGRLGALEQTGGEATIDAAVKRARLEELLSGYLPASEAGAILDRCLRTASLQDKPRLNVVEVAELYAHVERALSGIVGAAAAHAAMQRGAPITGKESQRLAQVYGRILAHLHVSPTELRRRIDFHQEREVLLTHQVEELTEKMAERDREIVERRRVEAELERARDGLEQRVLERTRELSETNDRLQDEIRERETAQSKLLDVHKELLETALRAGKAEVATNVLHNVGNVLNSVNVSVDLGLSVLDGSRLPGLARAVALLDEHGDDLPTFLASDPRGKQLPLYLGKLAENLGAERVTLVEELSSVRKNVDHVKTIISLQQSFAGAASALVERVRLPELIDDAVKINALSFERHKIRVVREYDEVPALPLQKHKVLQVLINLLSNAKYALAGAAGAPTLIIRLHLAGPGRVRVELEDNGMGIRAENLTRIFQHGFTTRKEGHGFGLHSGALAAREMGGSLEAHSEGEGKGATFVLELCADTGMPRAQQVEGRSGVR